MDYRLVNLNRVSSGYVGVFEYAKESFKLLMCIGLGLGVLMLAWAL